jgi:hypothetical protein
MLHLLPIYESLRVPSRFLGAAVVPFALVAAAALAAARRAVERAPRAPAWARAAVPWVQALLAVGVAVDLVAAAAPLLQHMDPVVQRGRAGAAFVQTGGADYALLPSYPVRGVGTRQCYTPIEWKPAAGVVEGAVAQVRVEPPDAGSVQPVRWTPNALEFAVDLRAPAEVVVNQNYETGWRASAGRIGAAREGNGLWRPGDPVPPGPQAIGLLAVSLPAGHHDLVLRHRPTGLALGLVLTALGVVLAVAWARGRAGISMLMRFAAR